MINESNYHIYIDDFVNGLLDEELEMEFVAFLDQHPGIMDDEMLEPREFHLEDSFKDSLKREVEVGNSSSDELFIAELEGDLSPEQKKALDKMIRQHPMLERDRKLFGLTRLDPAETISFPHKATLRKRSIFLTYTRWSVEVAAALLAGLIIFRFASNESVVSPSYTDVPGIEMPATPSPVQTAQENPEKIKEEKPVLAFVGKNPSSGVTGSSGSNTGQPGTQEIIEAQRLPIIQVSNVEPALKMQELSSEPELASLSSIYTPYQPSLDLEQEDQTVLQWAYKKIRGKVGMDERIVPQNEIARDAANIVLAKVTPMIQYNPTVNTIKIGGLEINRRSTR